MGKKKKKNQNSPNPCAASAMITSAEHGCSLFVLSLFFLLVLVLFERVEDEDANNRRRAEDDDKSSLRSMVLVCTFFLKVPFIQISLFLKILCGCHVAKKGKSF